MRKSIWIINHHADDMYFQKGGRHYSLAKYLKRAGYEPIIFCSNAHHGDGQCWFDQTELYHEVMAEEIGVPFVYVKGRPYIGNGKDRILCMIDFYLNMKKVAVQYVKKHGKPDVIYASSVHPLAVLVGEQLAKKYGIKCVAEVRDLWPESIVAMGVASKYHPLVLALRVLEKYIYKKSDALIFTMEGGYDYICDRKWNRCIPKEKVFHINNGVDLEDFQKNAKTYIIKDADLDDPNTFKIIYAGAVRQANGMEQLIEAARYLQNDHRIKFLIYGAGDSLDALRGDADKEGLTNILFKGHVEKKYIAGILQKGNLNLLYFNAAANKTGFYKYGSSQNKIFDYLASGKPIIANATNKYDMIDKYHCGVAKTISDGKQYAEEINNIVNMNLDDYNQMCENARVTAQEYSYEALCGKLLKVIEYTK